MKWWPAVLLMTLALAGCADKPHDLDAYLMRSSDVPGACYHVDPNDDQWRQVGSFLDWTENPGAVDVNLLRLDGVTPSDSRIAVFECKFNDGFQQYISGVLEFSSAAEAAKWVAAAQQEQQAFMSARCDPQAMVFAGEGVVGAIAALEAWHPQFESAANARFDQITQGGIDDYCA